MRTLVLLIWALWLSLCLSAGLQAQTQQPPSGPSSSAQLATMLPESYITADCLPVVPASSTTLAAFPCVGIIVANAEARPVDQAAASVGPLTGGDGIYWLAFHTDTSTAVSGWTRQSGTHYLWSKNDTPPALTSSALLVRVTVASGAITTIDDFRVPSSYVRSRTFDVTDPLYGGVANDSTDIGPALRQALAAARAQQAPTVSLPKGRYALTSAVIVDSGATIQGEGWSPFIAFGNTDNLNGTYIHISTTGFVPITLRASGSGVKDLAFYYDHPAPAAAWTPTDYPWTIEINHPTLAISDIHLDNLYFLNATRGIRQFSTGNVNSGRLYMQRIYGQFFTAGILLDYSLDVVRVVDVHMWPYWSGDDRVLNWQRHNLIALQMNRCDGCSVENFFAFSSNIGLKFASNVHGGSAGFIGKSLQFDGAHIGLSSDQDSGYGFITDFGANAQYTSGVPASGHEGSIGVQFTGQSNYFQFVNVEMTQLGNACIQASGTGNVISVTNIRCVNFNIDNGANPGLNAIGGSNLVVFGFQFLSAYPSHPIASYGGTFQGATLPGGAFFGQGGQFWANDPSGLPTLNFDTNSFLRFNKTTQLYTLWSQSGLYNTGGVKKYVCMQDGVLTVGTSCP